MPVFKTNPACLLQELLWPQILQQRHAIFADQKPQARESWSYFLSTMSETEPYKDGFTANKYIMKKDSQYRVAREFGYEDKVVKCALRKQDFKDAGSLIDYIEDHTQDLETEAAN